MRARVWAAGAGRADDVAGHRHRRVGGIADRRPVGLGYYLSGVGHQRPADRRRRTSVVARATTAVNQSPAAAFTSTCDQLGCVFDGSASPTRTARSPSYTWDFGDGATAPAATTDARVRDRRRLLVTLTVTDNQGATGTVTHTVTASPPPVNQPPTARFTSSCTQLACSFDGSASSDPEDITVAAWAWDFGDQTTGTGASPNHTYSAAGTFNVRLVVTDDDGATGEVTHSVTVTAAPPTNQPPVASFTSSCAQLACSFDGSASGDPDGSVVSYAWAFGDGAIGSGSTASHTYAAAGPQSVTLTVTDDQGASTSVTHLANPTAPVSSAFVSDAFNRTVRNALGTADIGGTWTTVGAASSSRSIPEPHHWLWRKPEPSSRASSGRRAPTPT